MRNSNTKNQIESFLQSEILRAIFNFGLEGALVHFQKLISKISEPVIANYYAEFVYRHLGEMKLSKKG